MLGVAIRIAERMGIHSESDLAKCTALEAEMRRRLWWSLVLFDTRIGEMADYKTTKLAPTWDCRIPLNVNDSDLRPEMKEPPEVLGKSTEALFAVVHSELGEFVRNTMFYLDFTARALKPIAKDVQNGLIPEGGELVALEKMIEDKYLKSCDPENPLHFMTIWTARAFLAKYRLMEYHSKYSSSSVHQTDAQRDAAISLALNRLECDTKLMTSPLTKGFLWLVHFHFPFPAYIHIVQDLRRRPISGQAEQAWAVMNDNYEARFGFLYRDDNPFFKISVKIVLQAWEAREVAFRQLEGSLTPPRFVSSIRHIVAQTAQSVQNDNTEQPHDVMGMGVDDFLMSMSMGFGSHMYSLERQASYAEMGPGVYPHMPGRAPLDVDLNQLDWSAMNWSSMNEPAGQAGPYTHMPGQAPFDADMNQLDSSGGLGFGE
jgi:Fungal specific transcription factor domain